MKANNLGRNLVFNE